jgi:hypothetical protein
MAWFFRKGALDIVIAFLSVCETEIRLHSHISIRTSPAACNRSEARPRRCAQEQLLNRVQEVNMKKTSVAVIVSLFVISGAAFAQDQSMGGIRESTDPSKAAAVEQHARELQSQQQNASSETAKPGADGKAAKKKARKHRPSKSAAQSGKSSGETAGQAGGAADSSSSK